jgi:putative oxidoreductase
MNSIIQRLLKPPVDGPTATIWLRIMCGGVFLWEGILKFVYANQGVGRFTKLGLPLPGTTADFVTVLEIVGGILLLLGLGTRLISLPFVIEILVAIAVTKIPLFLGTSPLPPPPAPPLIGFWAVVHERPLGVRPIAHCAILVYRGSGALVARRRTGPPLAARDAAGDIGQPGKVGARAERRRRSTRCVASIRIPA